MTTNTTACTLASLAETYSDETNTGPRAAAHLAALAARLATSPAATTTTTSRGAGATSLAALLAAAAAPDIQTAARLATLLSPPPAYAVELAIDWVSPRITGSAIATEEGRKQALAFANRIAAAPTLAEMQEAAAEAKAFACAGTWIDAEKNEAARVKEEKRRSHAAAAQLLLGSSYYPHGAD